jgi:hypothetical protein
MLLSRFEFLALLPDTPEITGYAIEITPSGKAVLEEWKLSYETFVDGLPEPVDARLAWHKSRQELGLLIFVKTKTADPPHKKVNFYLQPDPVKIRRRYGVNPHRPKAKKDK